MSMRRWLRVLLDGVNMAALVLITAVNVQLGVASLHDGRTAALAVASLVVLLRFPLASPALIGVGAAVGLGLRLA